MIAGLGNPDDKYQKTLHNAGFWFVDALAAEYGGQFRRDKKFAADCCSISISGSDIWLVKPQKYMNLSGAPVRAALDYYQLPVSQLLVAHDDIDLPPDTVRFKLGGGHGGHNGIRDVIQHCGPDFMRLRFGVGHPGQKDQVSGHVLQRATAETQAAIAQNIESALAVMPLLVEQGLNAAMKKLHTREV